MTQADKAQAFRSLHVPGDPVLLYNVWDAGGAATLTKAGASAIATGSWGVAEAQGYRDGQAIPLEFLLRIVERIVAATDLPVSVDFEGGYGEAPQDVAENVAQLMQAGVIGINFEDRIIGGKGLHPASDQAARIAAIRAQAEAEGVPLVINARTDVFFQGHPPAEQGGLLPDALARATAYRDAGADCFFVPGLKDPSLISEVCEGAGLPVNVMMAGIEASPADIAALGAARLSYGPAPYRDAMRGLAEGFRAVAGAE